MFSRRRKVICTSGSERQPIDIVVYVSIWICWVILTRVAYMLCLNMLTNFLQLPGAFDVYATVQIRWYKYECFWCQCMPVSKFILRRWHVHTNANFAKYNFTNCSIIPLFTMLLLILNVLNDLQFVTVAYNFIHSFI